MLEGSLDGRAGGLINVASASAAPVAQRAAGVRKSRVINIVLILRVFVYKDTFYRRRFSENVEQNSDGARSPGRRSIGFRRRFRGYAAGSSEETSRALRGARRRIQGRSGRLQGERARLGCDPEGRGNGERSLDQPVPVVSAWHRPGGRQDARIARDLEQARGFHGGTKDVRRACTEIARGGADQGCRCRDEGLPRSGRRLQELPRHFPRAGIIEHQEN